MQSGAFTVSPPRPVQKPDEGGGEGGGEGEGEAGAKLREVEQQLARTQAELEELREQVKVGVFSVEQVEDPQDLETEDDRETERLRQRVEELEAALKEREGKTKEEEEKEEEGRDVVRKLKEKVEELQAALTKKEAEKKDGEGGERVQQLTERVGELEAALEESRRERGGGGGEEEEVEEKKEERNEVEGLQGRVKQLQAELRASVPRAELEEVRVSMAMQLEQLARERAEAAMRLNDALLELERLRPPPHGEEEEEEEEDRSEGSEPSITSGERSS